MQKIIVIVIAVLILAGAGIFSITQAPSKEEIKVSVPPTVAQVKSETFSYNGQEGQDALTLLKAQIKVEQNTSGLVTVINGRKADDSKKEYWAFYVNGKMAQVGPAEYVTKATDKIEWKIENY